MSLLGALAKQKFVEKRKKVNLSGAYSSVVKYFTNCAGMFSRYFILKPRNSLQHHRGGALTLHSPTGSAPDCPESEHGSAPHQLQRKARRSEHVPKVTPEPAMELEKVNR